jgi:hypothetical protein
MTSTEIPAAARFEFITDDCRDARTCVCGMCNWTIIGATGVTRSCDYGDCRQPGTGYCPRFGYPVCERHAHANCHNHAKGAACTTKRAV